MDGDAGTPYLITLPATAGSLPSAERCLAPGADAGRVAEARGRLLAADDYLALADTFRALADPTRVKMIYSLLRQELCTCDLAAIIGISESAVSQHLRVLRRLRLVKSRRSGKQVFHSLDDLHIRILLAVCLNHVRDGGQHSEALHEALALVEGVE